MEININHENIKKIILEVVIKYSCESYIHLKINGYENEILNISEKENVYATIYLYIFSWNSNYLKHWCQQLLELMLVETESIANLP